MLLCFLVVLIPRFSFPSLVTLPSDSCSFTGRCCPQSLIFLPTQRILNLKIFWTVIIFDKISKQLWKPAVPTFCQIFEQTSRSVDYYSLVEKQVTQFPALFSNRQPSGGGAKRTHQNVKGSRWLVYFLRLIWNAPMAGHIFLQAEHMPHEWRGVAIFEAKNPFSCRRPVFR